MFVTFIIDIFVWHFLKFDCYRDTRAYILDPCIREFCCWYVIISISALYSEMLRMKTNFFTMYSFLFLLSIFFCNILFLVARFHFFLVGDGGKTFGKNVEFQNHLLETHIWCTAVFSAVLLNEGDLYSWLFFFFQSLLREKL